MSRIAMLGSSLVLFLVAGCGGQGNGSGPPASEPTHEDGATDTDAPLDDSLEFDEQSADEDTAGHEPEPAEVAEVRTAAADAERELEGKRLELDKYKATIDAARADLDAKLEAIAGLEKRLDERLGAGDVSRKRRDKRIGVLAKLILAMPPQPAAQMVAQMSDADAQAIVLAMSGQNERKASKLLAAMPGERAASLGQLYLDHDPKTLVDPVTTEPPPPAPTEPAPEAEPESVESEPS